MCEKGREELFTGEILKVTVTAHESSIMLKQNPEAFKRGNENEVSAVGTATSKQFPTGKVI